MGILSSALGKFGGDSGMFLVNRKEIEALIEGFKNKTLSKMKNGVTRMQQKATSLVQDKTPVEWTALKGSIGDYPANMQEQDNVFSADVGTSLEYALPVEMGVKGRTYTYHKIKSGNVTGVGAGMFRKTFDSVPDKKLLERILIDALK